MFEKRWTWAKLAHEISITIQTPPPNKEIQPPYKHAHHTNTTAMQTPPLYKHHNTNTITIQNPTTNKHHHHTNTPILEAPPPYKHHHHTNILTTQAPQPYICHHHTNNTILQRPPIYENSHHTNTNTIPYIRQTQKNFNTILRTPVPFKHHCFTNIWHIHTPPPYKDCENVW